MEQPKVKSQARRKSARRHVALLLLASASLLIGVGSARAAVVTVGSPLTASFPFPGSFGVVTATNLVLPEPGANVTSPVSGTIVRWRLSGASGGPFRLRVLTPSGGTTFTGGGTSEPRTPSSTATESFTTNLPISAGQQVGLDLSDPSDSVGIQSSAGLGARFGFWGPPPLAQGETQMFLTGASDEELGFNADVSPTNTFGMGAVTPNKKKGTATVDVDVPNPGELTGSGNGAKIARAAGAETSKAVSPGKVQLLIKAIGKKKRKLNKTGKAKLQVAVTYTPAGGDPSTQSLKLKLKKL